LAGDTRKIARYFPSAFSHAFPAVRLALYSGSVAYCLAFSLPGKCLTGVPFRLTVHQPLGGPCGPRLNRHHLIGFVGVVAGHSFAFSPTSANRASIRCRAVICARNPSISRSASSRSCPRGSARAVAKSDTTVSSNSCSLTVLNFFAFGLSWFASAISLFCFQSQLEQEADQISGEVWQFFSMEAPIRLLCDVPQKWSGLELWQ
jgi:hypothetical protein